MTTTDTTDYRLALKLLVKKGKVPTLPAVAQKLLELCRNDNASFSDFASVIESDQGMATRLLHVANSAFYGLRQKATTVERAVSALGLKYVRSVALGYNLLSSLRQFESAGFNQNLFWNQCLIRAIVGRQLGERFCPEVKEEAFLTGLLQDSGVMLLLQAIGEPYAKLWSDKNLSHYALYNKEKQLFNINHIEAAGFLARIWNLPTVLVGPISMHHTKRTLAPAKTSEMKLYQIAYFSGMLSFNDPKEICAEDLELSTYCRKVFNLDTTGTEQLFSDVQSEYNRTVTLFEDILDKPLDIADILIQTNKILSEMAEETTRTILEFADLDNDDSPDPNYMP